MLKEGPSMQAVIERPDKGTMQRLLQKIGEPRVLAWIAVAAVLIMWEIVVAAAQLESDLLATANANLDCACGYVQQWRNFFTDLLATLGGFSGVLPFRSSSGRCWASGWRPPSG